MSFLILSVLLWLWDNRSVDKIAQNNVARIEGWQAYEGGNFSRAAELYGRLVETSLFIDPSARLNLAHSYFRLKRYDQARRYYAQVARVNNARLSAAAQVQLGVIDCLRGDSATALQHFHSALETEPVNEEARFNFELIKKTFSGRTRSTRQASKSRSHSSSAGTELSQPGRQGGQAEVEKNDKKEETLRRLRSMNLTEEQALNLLNSLQENEVLYIHQRKSAPTTSRRDFGSW